jgi:hypothetical protein
MSMGVLGAQKPGSWVANSEIGRCGADRDTFRWGSLAVPIRCVDTS